VSEFDGKRMTVMGLGRFGGGVGVARFLLEHGAVVTVTDLDTRENLADSVAAVGERATYHLGGHRPEDFTEADLVVVNPAVRPDSEFLGLARRHGVPVTTEINLFFERCPARIVGVTGSAGKTTTVSMIGHALAGSGVHVGGNIGRSLLDRVGRMSADDLVVLELSSAQLLRLGSTGRAPDVAVVTNLAPNHIDWHGSMQQYLAAKRSILAAQSADDAAVLNWDDEALRDWADVCPGTARFFSVEGEPPEGVFLRDNRLVARTDGAETAVLDVRRMTVPGLHNVSNAAAAAAACLAVGAEPGRIGRALAGFQGAEHRLEFVREADGVRYFNDSKATTPASTMAALHAFEAPIVLILGGRDKGVSYEELAAEAARCRAVVLVGEMADGLDALLGDRAPDVPRERAESVGAAAVAAARRAEPGDVVLLSPACTSYDQFKNFEERGRVFKEAVSRLAGPQEGEDHPDGGADQ
jgi:UDP-N-acetylmuramoylalanine--D-glutamate ligase